MSSPTSPDYILACPHCSKKMKIRPALIGKDVKCSACAGELRVPPKDEPVQIIRNVSVDHGKSPMPKAAINTSIILLFLTYFVPWFWIKKNPGSTVAAQHAYLFLAIFAFLGLSTGLFYLYKFKTHFGIRVCVILSGIPVVIAIYAYFYML